MNAVSPDNDTPQRASRPFDATRNGFVLGEGAGFLVLEEWELAKARGARIYAELAGDGNSLSSYRITDSPPDGDGPIQSMQAALRDAGATAADIGYINAHGTSTSMNDRSESAAIHAVFGKRVGDGTTEAISRFNDVGVANDLHAIEERLDRALDKLTEGSYGVCDECGDPIASGRLKVRPESVLCLECARLKR